MLFFYCANVSADPCGDSSYCYDPDGGNASLTNINNPFHYVFIGAHPDDELMVYPLMKNFCAENNAYCAMIIGSRGRQGCNNLTPTQCGNVREPELKNSAYYLESDLWHFDFPDGANEISPYNWNGVKSAFDRSSRLLGYSNTVALIKSIFRKIKSPSSELVVISHSPDHGSTGHLDHKVLASLTTDAIRELKSEINIIHLKSESKLYLASNKPYIARNSDISSPICVTGSSKLTITNRHLTNFDVFNHGYNNIYLSQKFHVGDNLKTSSLYEFCYK